MKLFFIALLCCLLLNQAHAQVFLGLKAGFSLTRLKNEQRTPYLLIAGNAGLFCRMEGKKKLFLLSELLYSYKGSSLHMQYINLPVLAGWQFNRHFSALLGLEPGYLLNARLHIDGVTYTFTDSYQRFDLGLVLGAQWRFTQRWGIEARCIYGLTYALKGTYESDQGTQVLENKYRTRNEAIQLGLFYSFR